MASQNTEDVVESLDFENMQTVADDITELSRSDSVEDKIDFSVKSWREDMALVVEDKKLYVASNVLSLVSPVFTTMFEEQFKEDGPKDIELHGKKFDDVTEFLRCLYPNIMKSITQDNVFAVLPLADEFKVDRLKLECENILLRETNSSSSPDNVYKCLQQAFLHKLDKLRLKAVDIAANMDKQRPCAIDGRLQLPLDLQMEIQNKRMENMSRTVSKLKLDNASMKKDCQDLQDCVKHFWPDDLNRAERQQCEVGVLVLPLPYVRTITDRVGNTGKSIYGIKWSLFARQNKNKSGEETLALFLEADVPEHWQNWTCEVHYKVLLLSQNSNSTPMEKYLNHSFTQKELSWGLPNFIKMQQLSDDKYVEDGSALVKAYLMVKQPWCKPDF